MKFNTNDILWIKSQNNKIFAVRMRLDLTL